MASLRDGMTWFKHTFGQRIETAAAATPFDLNLLTALATQETFEVWGKVYSTLPESRVLELCVGDVIDAPSRTTFPVNKNDLMTVPDGDRIFAIARAALVDMGHYVPVYGDIAAAHPEKFCHGFGIFQYDIQFCKPDDDPEFFLERQWFSFETCLSKCLSELAAAQSRAGLGSLTEVSDLEAAYIAIAYNCGHFNAAKGLKQGYYDKDSKKYYGELVYEYIQLASQIAGPAGP